MSDLIAPPGPQCTTCGKVNRATARFCAACGTRLIMPENTVGDFYTQLARLQSAMAGAFNMGELRDLAFGLGIFDFASLAGETKEEKTRELIARMVREDRLRELMALCRRERPNIVWPFVEQSGPQPAPKPLDALFRQGISLQIMGELYDALQMFEEVGRFDPAYPGLRRQLEAVRKELSRNYIDVHGRVDETRMLASPSAAAPVSPPAAAPVPRSTRRVRPIIIAAVVILLALLLIVLWLVSQ